MIPVINSVHHDGAMPVESPVNQSTEGTMITDTPRNRTLVIYCLHCSVCRYSMYIKYISIKNFFIKKRMYEKFFIEMSAPLPIFSAF